MTDRKAEQSLPSSESKSLAIPFLMHAFFSESSSSDIPISYREMSR